MSSVEFDPTTTSLHRRHPTTHCKGPGVREIGVNGMGVAEFSFTKILVPHDGVSAIAVPREVHTEVHVAVVVDVDGFDFERLYVEGRGDQLGLGELGRVGDLRELLGLGGLESQGGPEAQGQACRKVRLAHLQKNWFVDRDKAFALVASGLV